MTEQCLGFGRVLSSSHPQEKGKFMIQISKWHYLLNNSNFLKKKKKGSSLKLVGNARKRD